VIGVCRTLGESSDSTLTFENGQPGTLHVLLSYQRGDVDSFEMIYNVALGFRWSEVMRGEPKGEWSRISFFNTFAS